MKGNYHPGQDLFGKYIVYERIQLNVNIKPQGYTWGSFEQLSLDNDADRIYKPIY